MCMIICLRAYLPALSRSHAVLADPYTYMYMFIHICICLYIYIYYLPALTRSHTVVADPQEPHSSCRPPYIYKCICTYMYVHTHVFTCMYITCRPWREATQYLQTHIHMHPCMYTYVCTYSYMNVPYLPALIRSHIVVADPYIYTQV